MHDSFLSRIQQQLIVSCQALPGSAMDRTDIVLAMARAAVDGGAADVRIEGVDKVRAVASHFAGALPIIGIVTRDLPDSPVRITPWPPGAQVVIWLEPLCRATRQRPKPTAKSPTWN